jgi:hypothetical protein
MKKTKNWKWEKRPRRARRHNLATTSDTTLEIPKSNLMLKKMWKESGGEKKMKFLRKCYLSKYNPSVMSVRLGYPQQWLGELH